MRKIIHVDMDCFYAAVECKYRPELKGKPLGVGGSPDGRGVLCTASYEARKFGVRSAMSSAQALRRCPDLILVRPNFERYKIESDAVREIFGQFTDQIEPLSLDEAYLDVSDSAEFGGSATRIAEEVRRRIRTELNLTASAGVAPNKFLAKIASDWKKPDGLFVIRPKDVPDFMPTLKVEKIFGVGKVTAKRMHSLGLKTCGDIQKTSVRQLTEWFGSWGEKLSNYANGIDERPVQTSRVRKSLSVEETFSQDIQKLEEGLAQIPALYEDWDRRMKKSERSESIRGIVVKIKFHDFKSTTHEMVCRRWPTVADFQMLYERAWHRRSEPVRLIGIGVRLDEGPAPVEDEAQLSFKL